MKLKTRSLAALAAFFLAGPASAATLLFSDNFNTVGDLNGGNTFNINAAGDQSGPAGSQTYATSLNNTGSNYAYQRGNGGQWLMFANGQQGGATDMRGSLSFDIAAAANSLSSALQISFNMSTSGGNPDATQWTSFTVGGGQNPFVNEASVGFSSLFRDNGGTQVFSNGGLIGDSGAFAPSSPTFTDGNLITFVLSDALGSGSAFNVSNGANDMVKMYVNGSLTNTFTGLNLDATDQFISFHANSVIAQIDNFSITAVPEPGAALLGGLGVLALLRRRR